MPSTTCGWCGRLANMTKTNTARYVPEPNDPFGRTTIMGCYACDYCKKLSLAMFTGSDIRQQTSQEYPQLERVDGALIWLPLVGVAKDFHDVPEHIAGAASEAHRCQSINAHRAAVLLARAAIEATAKEMGITNGTLASKIDQLCDQQFIRPHIRDEAHEIRHLGNDMAHGDFVQPVAPDDADSVLILMGEVLNEVFQGPAVAERLRMRRESRNKGQGQTSAPSTSTTG